jgi:hypothetical protein
MHMRKKVVGWVDTQLASLAQGEVRVQSALGRSFATGVPLALMLLGPPTVVTFITSAELKIEAGSWQELIFFLCAVVAYIAMVQRLFPDALIRAWNNFIARNFND